MEMAYPAAIALAGLVIAVALYVVGVRRKTRRKIVLTVRNELRRDETRPTVQHGPSLHTQAAESIQPERKVPSVRAESKLDKTVEVTRPLTRSPEPAAEAPLRVLLAQQGVPESPEAWPTADERKTSSEVAADCEVQPAQGVTETHVGRLEERAEDQEPTPATKDPDPSAVEPTGGSVRQDSRGALGRRTPQEPRRISPEKRGGRSRAGDQESENEKTNKGRNRSPKPEIVCCKRDREWVLAVEIPEELRTISVFQGGIRLTEDNQKKGCWRLATLGGDVLVSILANECESQSKVALGDNNHLVFKLTGRDQNQGRHVKRPTRGSYLVVVPIDWKRDEALAGPAPAEPEDVCLEAYRAHFFCVGESQRQ